MCVHTCMYVYMYVYIYIYIFFYVYIHIHDIYIYTYPLYLPDQGKPPNFSARGFFVVRILTTVGFHNFNLRIFNLRVSNPDKLIVDILFLTRCRISMCQGLSQQKHDEISEIDRTRVGRMPARLEHRTSDSIIINSNAIVIIIIIIICMIHNMFIILCYTMLYYIISYHIISYYIMLYCIISYYIIFTSDRTASRRSSPLWSSRRHSSDTTDSRFQSPRSLEPACF